MKVKELIKELKKFNPEDECYLVPDPENIEDGQIVGLVPVNAVSEQSHLVDMGLDFDEEREILIW